MSQRCCLQALLARARPPRYPAATPLSTPPCPPAHAPTHSPWAQAQTLLPGLPQIDSRVLGAAKMGIFQVGGWVGGL